MKKNLDFMVQICLVFYYKKINLKYTEKNSSLNFTELFKICGHRYLRNRVQ